MDEAASSMAGRLAVGVWMVAAVLVAGCLTGELTPDAWL